MTFGSLETGTGMDKSIPEVRDWAGMEKTHFLNSGTGREWKKNIPKIQEWEGYEKIYFQNSGSGRE